MSPKINIFKIFKIFTTLSSIVISIFLIDSTKLDKLLLVENRNYGYWNYLTNMSSYYISKDPVDNGTDNLLISTFETTTYDGFTITANDDGTIVFNGCYTGESPRSINICNIKSLAAGDYILSDGNISISNGIQLCIQETNYLIGGKTDYGKTVSLPGDGKITWNPEKYMNLNVILQIYPGFSADNLIFYPMLRKEEIDSVYQSPVRLIRNTKAMNNQSDYYKFNKFSFLKLHLNEITKSDWKIFKNRITYNNADWTVIDFYDGTGLQIKNQAVYGTLSQTGMIEDVIDQVVINNNGARLSNYFHDSITGIAGIECENKIKLSDITDFEGYLKAIDNQSFIVFIAFRDEGVKGIQNNQNKLLNDLGSRIDFTEANSENSNRKYYRYSYYGYLRPGQEAVEEISEDKLEHNITLDNGSMVNIISAGKITNDSQASVTIDGKEYAVNRRGMNIVVYDKETQKVVDSVCFDTYSDLACSRAKMVTD